MRPSRLRSRKKNLHSTKLCVLAARLFPQSNPPLCRGRRESGDRPIIATRYCDGQVSHSADRRLDNNTLCPVTQPCLNLAGAESTLCQFCVRLCEGNICASKEGKAVLACYRGSCRPALLLIG